MKGATAKTTPKLETQPLPVDPGNIFHFPEGIPAFENAKKFIFLHKPETSPFVYMQALEPSGISFVCIDPFLIYSGYRPKISMNDMNALSMNGSNNLLILSIVTLARDPDGMTTNLQGPIVLNLKNLMGRQIICDGQDYPLRYKIWDAVKQHGKKKNAEIINDGATDSAG